MLPRSIGSALAVLAAALSIAALPARAQDRPLLDILNIESSVQAEVTPDLAVVTLSAFREGADAASLTEDVENAIARALSEAKGYPGLQAATGGFNTSPRLDAKGQRTSWQVRADLILKSKDFVLLSRLVGKLTSGPNALQISTNAFEVSSDLKQSEEGTLIERGITAFKTKAGAASKSLGYASFAIREITIGEVSSSGGVRAMAFAARDTNSGAAALPLEAGRVSLQLRVSGSVQMRR